MTRTKNALRVYRGGSWNDYVPSWVRAPVRYWLVPDLGGGVLGVRCVLRGRQPR